MTAVAEVLSTYLAATDSRDKFLKGAGCFFKALGEVTDDTRYSKVGAQMSDARCLMRLGNWFGNIQKITNLMDKPNVEPRDTIFLVRVVCDGIFSFLDNIVYIGRFYNPKDPKLAEMAKISRASLFYGYVAAVLLDIYDLTHDKAMPNRRDRFLVLTRNAFDMLSAIGNVCSYDMGVRNASLLGLASAIIATREQLTAAASKVHAKAAIKAK